MLWSVVSEATRICPFYWVFFQDTGCDHPCSHKPLPHTACRVKAIPLQRQALQFVVLCFSARYAFSVLFQFPPSMLLVCSRLLLPSLVVCHFPNPAPCSRMAHVSPPLKQPLPIAPPTRLSVCVFLALSSGKFCSIQSTIGLLSFYPPIVFTHWSLFCKSRLELLPCLSLWFLHCTLPLFHPPLKVSTRHHRLAYLSLTPYKECSSLRTTLKAPPCSLSLS